MTFTTMKRWALAMSCLVTTGAAQAQSDSELLGELPMGYEQEWTGRVLFNSEGGYIGNMTNQESDIHGWSPLYEAKKGETYTIHFEYPTPGAGNGRVQFRTPITLDASHVYTLKISALADKDATFCVALSENDNDDVCLMAEEVALTAGKIVSKTYSNLTGVAIDDMKLALELRTGDEDYNTTLKVKGISLYDTTTQTELWVGTTYFNWCYNWTPVLRSRVKDMPIEGRTLSTAWMQADYDDSQWTQAPMPVGNYGYLPEVRTIWPGGDNTNYWIRRNFELSEVKTSTAYFVHVCHDDSYRLYVNGHLLDEDQGWTNGKNPVSVEVPARYLKVGRNVIAAYVQQNWGGKFYDCGMTIRPDTYEDGDADVDIPTSVFANEVMVGNIDQYLDHSFNYGSWLELHNTSASRVSLMGLYISDDPNQLDKYMLPNGIGVIPPHGYATLYFDHHPTDGGVYGDKAKLQIPFKLKTDGGTLYLSEDGRTPFITLEYPASIARCSWARDEGYNTWGYTGVPTPSAPNGRDFATERLPAPEVSEPSRLFTDPFPVQVTIPQGCTLRYTLDGTTPTLTNGYTDKTGFFAPTSTKTFRFRLFRDGYLPSPVVTRTYILKDKDYYLPIISITTDPENLYGDSIGIYVDGVNGVDGRNHGRSNRNMDWQRPANVEYITADGQMVINQEANICISGGWSRHFLPASIKLKANKVFEGKNSFDYPFFRYKPFNKYKQLLVRNGGNDNDSPNHARIRDAITQQTLISNGFYVDAQDYQPVHLFFNGEYIGQLNLREPNNRFNGTANYGYDDDEMDAFEFSNGYFQMAGTRQAFQEWLDLSRRAGDDEAYEQIRQRVDIDEVINYWAAITYIGCSDWIMNNNNSKGYRSLPDGKFHLTVFDQDWGWSNTDGVRRVNGQTYNDLLAIYNGMKQNAQFRRQFVDAYCILHGSVFTPERCLAIADSICQLVGPALAMEGRITRTSWNEQKDRMTSEWARNDRMQALRDAYGLGQGMNVQVKANIPQASLLLNDQPVPDASLNGTLFAPVTLTASAPAGYVFKGWKSSLPMQTDLFGRNDEWRYYDQGSLDGTGWKTPDYDDSSWASGPAPLGYWVGREDQRDYRTIIEYGGNTAQKHPAYYFRKDFTLADALQADDELVLGVQADDGFVLYVNGVERHRYLMPEGDIYFDTYAVTYAPDALEVMYIRLQPEWLQEGRNVLAVEVHNNVPGSSDIYWTASLSMKGTSASAFSRDNKLVLTEDKDVELMACFEPMPMPDRLADGWAPVRVNEVSAGNDIYINEYGKRDDWVELYNTTDEDIDLAGMYLSDKANAPQKYQIQAVDGISTVVPAHGHLLVWASKREAVSQLHAPFKLDNADGCFVSLQAADGSWTDVLRYDEHDAKQTFGRYPDGGHDTYTMSRPTIRRPNMLTTYDFDFAELDFDPLADPSTHVFELAQGWNWFSHNMALAVPAERLQDHADALRSSAATLERGDDGQWQGALSTLQPTLGYKVRATENHELSLTDRPYDTSLPARVQKGWNWIGQPMANATEISAALGNYVATEGDMIVGQQAFACYTGGQWTGTLTSLVPGQAYMLRSGQQQAFEWNALTRHPRAKRRYVQPKDEPETLWAIDVHAYPDVMPIVARVEFEDQPVEGNGYMVAAFVGDECRGIARNEDGLLYLLIYGEAEEDITLRLMDAAGETYPITNALKFRALDAKGTPDNPYVLVVGPALNVEQPTVAARVLSTQYFTLDGCRITRPTRGIYLERTTYDNGRTVTRKLMR